MGKPRQGTPDELQVARILPLAMIIADTDYQLIVETTSALIWHAELSGYRNYFNPAWLVFTGRQASQELGEGWIENIHPDDLNHYVVCSRNQIIAQEPYSLIFRLHRHDGSWRWIREMGRPLVREGCPIGYLGTGHDVTDLVEDLTEARLLQQWGEQDALTGLLSRAYVTHLLTERYGTGPLPPVSLGVVFMDLDNFKAINDTCGHLAGDRALQAASQHLSSLVRSGDWLCRWGGDEFLLVVNRPTTELAVITQRITDAFDNFRFAFAECEFLLGCSVGAAVADGQATLDELLAQADTALYADKLQRRGTQPELV
jgi:diguanylate cyclase (GGDEF)-like protein/PAS domain S-box-containing protein